MNGSPALTESFNRLMASLQGLGDVVFHQGGWLVILCFAAGIVLYRVVRHFDRQAESQK